MKSRFSRRVSVDLLILFLIHVTPVSGADVTQRAHIKGGQIISVRPRTEDAIIVGEPFYFTIQVGAVRARKASIREVTVNHYLCVRDVSSGALIRTYHASLTVSSRSDVNTGGQNAQYLSVGSEFPPGEYEIVAFVMVSTDKAAPIVVDMTSCCFRVKDKRALAPDAKKP